MRPYSFQRDHCHLKWRRGSFDITTIAVPDVALRPSYSSAEWRPRGTPMTAVMATSPKTARWPMPVSLPAIDARPGWPHPSAGVGIGVREARATVAYFFISGWPRTGTNLLQSILCADKTTNPKIRSARQLRLIMIAYETGKVGLDSYNQDYFDDIADFRAYHADCVEAFLKRVSRRFHPARHLVLKETYLAASFPELPVSGPGPSR